MTINIRAIVEGLLALVVLGATISAEMIVLRYGIPAGVDGVVVGRILGTMDALALIVANFYWGNTRSSMQQVDAITSIGQAAANTPIHITLPGGEKQDTTPAAEVVKAASASVPEFKNLK